ncbi:MAG: alanine racemase [Nitrospira bacterium HGW-Nitrospira-1]|nr:MAG: alanine racemase [Nitrospira bacterium HGW-Nitrospira-1]
MTQEKQGKKKTRVNRGTVSEIDLFALQHNLEIIRRIAGNRTVIAVVKADAYGHGAVEISKKFVSEGISYLAAAYTEEAKILRESGVKAKIIVLFDCSDIADYFVYDLIPVIYDMETAAAFSREAKGRGKKIPVHLKIDTGMGRIGFMPDKAVSAAVSISNLEGVELEGLLSHFSEADLSDRSYAVHQLEVFQNIRAAIQKKTGRKLLAHMANSAALFSFKEGLLDAVRPGLALYGYSPFHESYGLRPLMKIKTKILSIRRLPAGTPVSYGRTFITKRESKIAVVPVGYADGYNRLFSNNADMLVRGMRAPVAGRICMDLTMIDVTKVGDIAEGEEVVLLGRQGRDMITAKELSSRINTIPYEIITSLGSRAKKEYLH